MELGPFQLYKRRTSGPPGCLQDCVINLPVFLSFVIKVDFWRGPDRPSLPVDMRVPFSALKDIKAYLESHGLAYSIMIKDIQVRSCPSAAAGVSPSYPVLVWAQHGERTSRAKMDVFFLEFHLHFCEPTMEGMKPHTSQGKFKSKTEFISHSMVMAG